MCILCVVQRWSRRVATMLPWLVVPLILLWALSQLFPPNFRFEVTSPRLACVIVLLATLVWYEILMPRLSVWRERRSARLREQRMVRAIELQKLKKSATRKCRNCNTPYRDQNPGGGKFMCSYCGHVSRRPVLDWYGDENGGDGRCLAEKSYSGVLVFVCRVVEMVYEWGRLVWGKVVRRDDGEGGGEGGGLSRNGEGDGGNFSESRGERARRKAEEKRQARLEREMLEEEERKQREDVARLVEERRKLRDEMLEAEEQERLKVLASVDGERESRKETERRRRERRKEKGSNKSNSDDGEEVEKRASRESEKKREFDKKGEIERQKALVENFKSQVLDGGNVSKVGASKSRYFDRMKGTFLSSSRGVNSASLFGRTAQAAPTVNKVSKPTVGLADNGQISFAKKDAPSSQNVTGKSTLNGDHQPVQPRTTVLKKSWHQLFTRSSPVSPDPEISTLNFPTQNGYLDVRGVTDKKIFPSYSDDKQVHFGRLPLSGYSSPNGSLNGDLVTQVEDYMFSPMKEPAHSSVIEDVELFEDPCYVPDPVAFQGSISDSLNKLPLDLGTGFIAGNKVEGPCIIKNLSVAHELTKPSPIERHVSCAPKSQKLHSSSLDESTDAQGKGTWQMWGTPLTQDGLGIAGGPSSLFSTLVQCKSQREDLTHPMHHNPIIPQMANADNPQTRGRFSPVVPGMNGNDPWLQNSPFSPLPIDRESHFLPLDLIKNITQNEDNTPISSETVHPFEVPPSDGWSKEAWPSNGTHDVGNSATPVEPPNIGSLFSTGQDVPSVWSFNHQ